MSLQEKFTSKQLTIIIIAICAVFIFLGIFTMVIGNEAESSSEKYVTVDSSDDSGSDVSGRKYKFSDREDRSEGGAQEDSLTVNKPMEGDPYQELDELIGLESVKEEVHSLRTSSRYRRCVRKKD